MDSPSPIQVARELKSACENDLNGDKKEAQRRFDLGKSMWDGFERLLTLAPEIQDLVIWGSSDERLGIGFSFAHYLAKMKHEDQRTIIDISFEHEKFGINISGKYMDPMRTEAGQGEMIENKMTEYY